MKTFFIAVYGMVFFVLTANSQQQTPMFTTKIFKTFVYHKRAIPVDFMGRDSIGNVYFQYAEGALGNGAMSIVQFNGSTMLPTGKELDLSFSNNEHKTSLLGIVFYNKKLLVFTLEKFDKANHIYAESVQLENLSFNKDKKLIVKISVEKEKVDEPYFRFNKDKSIIALYCKILNRKNDNEIAKVIYLNNNLEQLGTLEYDFNVLNKFFSIDKVLIEDNGDLIIAARKKLQEAREVNMSDETVRSIDSFNNVFYNTYGGDFEYNIYRLSKGIITSIFSLKPQNHLINQIDLIKIDSDYVITGFFSDRDVYSIKGTLYCRFNAITGKTLAKKLSYFQPDFFTLLSKEKHKADIIEQAKKFIYEDPFYVMTSINTFSNKEILLMAQQVHTYTSNYVTTFYRENIAFVHLDTLGKIVWNNKIGRKITEDFNDKYSSTYTIIGDTIYTIFNASIKNLEEKTEPFSNAFATFGSDNFCLMGTKVKGAGEVYKTAILKSSQLSGYAPRLNLTNFISDKKHLLFLQDKSNVQNQVFIELNINE